MQKLKILFVCTVNRMRSATAHKIYELDERLQVRSAGTDPTANVPLNAELLSWADAIVVMEKEHRGFIRKHYPSLYTSKKIVCLYIPGEYDYMDPNLIASIRLKFEDVMKRGLLG